MSRRRRIQTPGLIRHVMSRGNGRMAIFLDGTDYRFFVYLLGEILERYGIECWNYCIMPNHYHATLQPSRPNLSEALRDLNGDYAKWWNRRHGKVGHVLQGRPKDQIVQRDQYILALSRYVVMNPVRAQLVQRPEEWRWSSYRATVGLTRAPAFLAISLTLRLFGDAEDGNLRDRFAQFVIGEPGDDDDLVDRIRSNEQVLGDRAFKASVSGSTRASEVLTASPRFQEI